MAETSGLLNRRRGITPTEGSNPSVSASPARQPESRMPQAPLPLKNRKPRQRTPRPRSLRLHGTVARDLGIRIVTGGLKPGEILEGEIAASEQFKVSRTAYREAIRILAAKRGYSEGLSCDQPRLRTAIQREFDSDHRAVHCGASPAGARLAD